MGEQLCSFSIPSTTRQRQDAQPLQLLKTCTVTRPSRLLTGRKNLTEITTPSSPPTHVHFSVSEGCSCRRMWCNGRVPTADRFKFLALWPKLGTDLSRQRLPEKSYKRECQETYLTVGSLPTRFCLGIQPNRLRVHARIDEWSSLGSHCFVSWYETVRVFFPPWFLSTVVTAPPVS